MINLSVFFLLIQFFIFVNLYSDLSSIDGRYFIPDSFFFDLFASLVTFHPLMIDVSILDFFNGVWLQKKREHNFCEVWQRWYIQKVGFFHANLMG